MRQQFARSLSVVALMLLLAVSGLLAAVWASGGTAPGPLVRGYAVVLIWFPAVLVVWLLGMGAHWMAGPSDARDRWGCVGGLAVLLLPLGLLLTIRSSAAAGIVFLAIVSIGALSVAVKVLPLGALSVAARRRAIGSGQVFVQRLADGRLDVWLRAITADGTIGETRFLVEPGDPRYAELAKLAKEGS